MKCPFCNAEMEPGNVFGDKFSLKWMHEDKKLILGAWTHDAIVLAEKGVIRRPRFKAFICIKCKKLIADI